ncbi:KRAB [Mytilus coruscus]|uniref:KRAB n=1 Tax=Mytilus coruscus TaxID=42192 RepID=A0A6J8EHB7_MYTCO|nr:KRAB [Mytilus coruscus]
MSSIEIKFNGGNESQKIFIPASTGKKRIHLVFTKSTTEPPRNDKTIDKIETLIIGEKIWYSCKVCDARFTLLHSARNHVRLQHVAQKKFLCSLCGKGYITTKEYEKHMMVHAERPYQCEMCRRRFDTEEKLKIHFEGQHANRPRNFQCGNCHKLFLTMQHLKEHILIHSDEKNFTCEICYKSFFRETSYKLHKKTHLIGPFPCKICKKEFKYEKTLRTHINFKHIDKIIVPETNENISESGDGNTSEKLKEHTATENVTDIDPGREEKNDEDRRIEMDAADESKTKENMFDVNSKGDSDELETQNKAEDNKVKVKEEKEEVLFRTRQTNFTCEECGKVFNRKDNLKNHMRLHSGAKPFVCTICNKSFRQSAHLYRHTKSHTGERNEICTICGKAFFRPEHLRKHQLQHLPPEQKPFNFCELCGKNVINMRRHIRRIHEEGKSFFCFDCKQKFRFEENFKNHVVLGQHIKESHMRRTCPICHNVFCKPAGVRRHLRNVHGQDGTVKPYTCSVCQKGFEDQQAFQKHVVKGHGLLGQVKKVKKPPQRPSPDESESSTDNDSEDEEVIEEQMVVEEAVTDTFDVLEYI